jgi:hypothetical protein
MQLSKIHYVLFFAVLMLAAKPFVGFSAFDQIKKGDHSTRIIVKAFTKRKQEYVEDSAFDVSAIQKSLANPILPFVALFSVFLNTLLPSIFKQARQLTAGILSAIYLNIFPVLHRYLLSGKLTI